MSTERRGDRKAVSFPATVTAGGRTARDVVSNVSPTGLYLVADRHRFRAGERVRVAFSLPIEGRLVPVTVEGRIARVVRDALHRTRGIGVELLAPPAATIRTLEAYHAAHAGHDGAGDAGEARPADRALPLDRRLEEPVDDGDRPTGPAHPLDRRLEEPLDDGDGPTDPAGTLPDPD